MDMAIQRLKHWLDEKGLDVEEFWLTRQDLRVCLDFKPELRAIPLNLLLYASEFMRQLCYYDTEEPQPGELLMKTSCFIKQLGAGNWNLKFTESGNLYVTDVPLPCVQLQELTEREEAETDHIDVSFGSVEGLAIDLVTDGEECSDYKSDSEF